MFSQHFADASAKWNDWMHLMMSALSPSDLHSGSLGLCAHLPFLEQSIDFSAVPRMAPEFYINAYNLDRHRMQIWSKDQITPAHVRASLSFPSFTPTEIDGEHYIEGAALDTLNFTLHHRSGNGRSPRRRGRYPGGAGHPRGGSPDPQAPQSL
jgi:predicted acylesterase/phospholipase RssA